MRYLIAAVDGLARASAWVAAGAMLAMVVLITLEMLSRAALGRSVEAAWEYSAYAMGVVLFGGLGWTFRTDGHIKVAVLELSLPPGLRKGLRLAAAAAGTVLSSLLAVSLARLSLDSYNRGTRSILPSETLLWIPQALLAAGAAVFVLQLALHLVLVLQDVRQELADPDAAAQQGQL